MWIRIQIIKDTYIDVWISDNVQALANIVNSVESGFFSGWEYLCR